MGENRDKGDGKKAASHDMVQDFRNDKGDLIGIHPGFGPSDSGNGHFPEHADDTAGKDRGHHDKGGEADFFQYGFMCGHWDRVYHSRMANKSLEGGKYLTSRFLSEYSKFKKA